LINSFIVLFLWFSYFYFIIYSEGIRYFEENNFSKAIDIYSEGIALNNKSSVFYCKRSQCFLKLTKWNEALVDAKMSIEVDPNMLDAYEVAAVAYENLNDIKSAYGLLFQATEYLKNNVRTVLNNNEKVLKFKEMMLYYENQLKKIEK
jgi:tetratricopeptide (TPR) repeat protein